MIRMQFEDKLLNISHEIDNIFKAIDEQDVFNNNNHVIIIGIDHK